MRSNSSSFSSNEEENKNSKRWISSELRELASFKTGRLNSNAAVKDGLYPFFTTAPRTYRINDYAFDQDAILLGGNNANGIFQIKRYSGKFNAYQRTYVISVDEKSPISNDYLFYAIKIQLGLLRNSSLGTATRFLTKPMLDSLIISYPDDYDEMNYIARTMKVIDEKIENNKQINHHLEQIAQTIFTELCSEGEHAVLSDILTVCYGKDHKRLGNGAIPCYGSGGVMRYVDEALYNCESVLIPRKGSLNNVLYINEPFWTVDTMFYTHMMQPNVAKFVYFTVRNLDLAGMNVGSAVPSMTTAVLNALGIVLPSKDNLARFEEIVSPMFLQMQTIRAESAQLAFTRDTLLPKLMSGELSAVGIQAAK